MTSTNQAPQPQDDSAAGEKKQWRELLFSLPGLIVTTVVVGVASWAVTYLTTAMETWGKDAESVVTVSVETNPAKIGGFSDQSIVGVVPIGTRPATGPGGGCSTFHDWLTKNGGVDAGKSKLQVAVQGSASHQVQINNLRVIVVKRDKPPPTVGLTCPSAGNANLRPIDIDLDQALPRAKYKATDGRPFGFTVNKGEIETFLVTALAKHARYAWYLELDVTSEGKTSTLRVDNKGKPFRTAPLPNPPMWSWDYDSTWTGSDQRLRVGEAFIQPKPSKGSTG
ncbi:MULTISPECIES: hypothetical protein [Streptomyces]|uniref:hypothetical protein n=1 Tax=Streptomyces TaxID=1883 RepID=UPI000ABE161F|nr:MULTISPECIES: hypothetical protein [Streptomyces]MDI5912414.1 hypothetical protein [Streptomyces sp. 12257]